MAAPTGTPLPLSQDEIVARIRHFMAREQAGTGEKRHDLLRHFLDREHAVQLDQPPQFFPEQAPTLDEAVGNVHTQIEAVGRLAYNLKVALEQLAEILTLIGRGDVADELVLDDRQESDAGQPALEVVVALCREIGMPLENVYPRADGVDPEVARAAAAVDAQAEAGGQP